MHLAHLYLLLTDTVWGFEDLYNGVISAPNKAELSYELISAAASFEAAKGYEKHCANNGRLTIPGIKATLVTYAGAPDSHAQAKEVLAGYACAFIDRIVETKDLELDKVRAKSSAREHIDNIFGEEEYLSGL